MWGVNFIGWLPKKGKSMEDKCYYCNPTPYGVTSNIAAQRFNDNSVSNIKLNQYNPKLLTADTWNTPNNGANKYTVIGEINFCPMCGRKLADQ